MTNLKIIAVGVNNFSGTIPASIFNLSGIRVFDVAVNHIRGSLPSKIGNVLPNLEILSIARNQFTGSIPISISNALNLFYFNTVENDLIGGVPTMEKLHKLHRFSIETNHLGSGHNVDLGFLPSLNNATGLVLLNLGDNNFGGMLTETIGNLSTKLRRILLGYNQISGSIPYGIRNLINLDIIRLAGNHFTSNLPFDIGKLQNLHDFHLSENEFSGNIPSSLGNLSSLITLDLSQNSLHGSIPPRLGGCKNLLSLNLAHNKLSGPIPQLVIGLSSLSHLDLFQNYLTSSLPVEVENLKNLGYLSVSNNMLSSEIPSTLGSLVNLALLGMYSNQFTGEIPPSIGNLQKLQRLSFDNNKLSGKIPNSIGNLSLLTELSLAGNRIEGTIPSSLGNCQNLLLLHLFLNNLSGTIPGELLRISSLSISLNLAQNRLFGSLPAEVGNLKNLMELDISENGLSGEIPSSLGIANFDLSHNNLSGKIPTFLEKFALQKLNLSFNDFEGEVPMKGVFTNESAISIIGNYRLCGGISELQLPNCITQKSKHKMPLSHILPITIASLLVGGALVSLCIIYCFKKKRTTHNTIPLLKELFLKISYEKLFKATDGFSSANLIGFGSFGSVYKGILDQDGEFVAAVKVLNLQNRGAAKSFMAECETLRNIRHRNLVTIITSCSSVDFQGNEFKALVYEFMPNGSLEGWLHSTPETNNGQNEHRRLNLLERINIAIDVACALDYLHHQCHTPIIHCDLKPSNILLDNDMVAHVGDFGLARFCPELTIPNQSSSIGIRGSIGYVPPEYGMGSEISTYGDVYSYGILLLEMITGKRPTENMFEEGHNLHNFARTALPDRVMEIADPVLLDNEEEETRATTIQVNNRCKIVECLISMVNIGVACSTESPQGRMSISNILYELHLVKNKLLKDELRTRTLRRLLDDNGSEHGMFSSQLQSSSASRGYAVAYGGVDVKNASVEVRPEFEYGYDANVVKGSEFDVVKQ
ncbi:hypothetical protein ACSBR1_007838 [Camellia fascicularis]